MSKIIQGRAVSKIMLGGREIVRSVYQGRDVYDASGGPSGGGGIDEYTTLLLHFDGNFVDAVSGRAGVLTGAEPTFADGQFGQGWSNPNAGAVTFTDDAAFDFGADDWTVDFWINFYNIGLPNFTVIFGTSGGSGTLSFTVGNSYNNHSFIVSILGQQIYFDIQPFAPKDTPHHFALVCHAGQLMLFLNGRLLTTAARPDLYRQKRIHIGGADGTYHPSLCVDEFRVSKVARWTADFEVPAKPYS